MREPRPSPKTERRLEHRDGTPLPFAAMSDGFGRGREVGGRRRIDLGVGRDEVIGEREEVYAGGWGSAGC